VRARVAATLAAVLGLAVLSAACSTPPTRDEVLALSKEDPADLTVAYASDYLSFVGQDDQGPVAFALDTNRGRDGDEWQAEHFVVLYDGVTGWREVAGDGPYPNPGHALGAIPDSPAFSFTGTPADGLRVHAPDGSLDLVVEPVVPVIDRHIGTAAYRMGAAAAVLTWEGRTLHGRVIHEYLFLPGFNRLSRTYIGALKGFSGLYLVVDGRGDFYLHHHRGGGFMAELSPPSDGFLVLDGERSPVKGMPMEAIEVEVSNRTQGPGLYRWPIAWRGSFTAGGTAYTFDLTTERPNTIATWVIGGFRMCVVTGTLRAGDATYPVLGLGELIM
jgi:hypothetical protein